MKLLRAHAASGTTRASGFATRTAALLVAALAITAALGYWGVGAYRVAQQQRLVASLVKDTSHRLQQALAVEMGRVPAETPRTVSLLDEHAQEVDKHVIELRGLNAAGDRDLLNSAEEYMLTVRQILRNQAASHRYHLQVVAGNRALRDHMSRANRRSASWIQEALRAKDRLERAYFDYRLSADAFGRLLGSYPRARSGLAQRVGAGLLLGDALVAEVGARVRENSKRTADEVESARRLAAVK
jgi:hypothetical protein